MTAGFGKRYGSGPMIGASGSTASTDPAVTSAAPQGATVPVGGGKHGGHVHPSSPVSTPMPPTSAPAASSTAHPFSPPDSMTPLGSLHSSAPAPVAHPFAP
ncbi:MAG: hypothetical protein ACHREM_33065, partial [Polyangiales bacterium]